MEFKNSNPIQLKIKAKTLAAEAVIIKEAENATKVYYGGAIRKTLGTYATEFDYPKPKVALPPGIAPTIGMRVVRAAVKRYIASLTPEQLGRFERRREAARNRKHLLHEHRINVVRREARATHLARAFLMGRSYHDVEQKAFQCPLGVLKERIENMVLKYGSGDRRVVQQKLEEWFQDGWKYYQQYWKVINSAKEQLKLTEMVQVIR